MHKIISAFAALIFIVAASFESKAQSERPASPQKPRLIVNIVVSGLPGDLLEKFGPALSSDGFSRFMNEGMNFRSARYDYMQTISPTGLATLTTGVNPSMHGVVARTWIDYVTGTRISLTDDDSVQGVGSDAGTERHSPRHIVMPTAGDRLPAESPGSKVISIAADPVSAIVAGGRSGTAYWMDSRAVWVSSTAYMPRLPDAVATYNASRPANLYIETGWTPARPARLYTSRSNTIFGGQGGGVRITSFSRAGAVDYAAMLRSPVGNTLVADFARRLVADEGLGADDATDMLNVCFDASRHILERYGSASMEVEDMLYRLDMDIAEMVREISSRVGAEGVMFVLTSDHGMSDGHEATTDLFNVAQFRTILNSFLGVQFGPGDWVLDYIDRQVYLNRNLIYMAGLNLEDVQNRAAAFVLQFRGVSHVLTATALAGGYFGAGYGARMQHSFYPRRGGDLMVNLMPGWIEQRDDVRSLSGSMYDYDTHVPLMLLGWKIPARRIDTDVDMTALAPSLARIMGIGRPIGSGSGLLPGLEETVNQEP